MPFIYQSLLISKFAPCQYQAKQAMIPLLICLPLLLTITTTLTTIANAYSPPDALALPHGGSLFSLSSHQLFPRQDVDCGGDPDCTVETWGCQCGFTDGSFIDDNNDPSSPSAAASTSSDPAASLSGTSTLSIPQAEQTSAAPTIPTSTPTPPPPPPSTSLTPPVPSQTSSNNKGSSLCSSIGSTTCRDAYSQYNDIYLYTAYTSYILSSGAESIVNDLFPLYADDGCAAMFTCNSDAAYAVGMTGAQIKAAFDNLYANDKVKTCGSSYLSNGCHVTANGCNDCKPGVPCGSLSAENIANKYPCYS